MEAISFPYNSAAYMPVIYFEILQYTYKVSLQARVCVHARILGEANTGCQW